MHLHLKDLLETGVLDPQPPDRGGTQALQPEGDDELSEHEEETLAPLIRDYILTAFNACFETQERLVCCELEPAHPLEDFVVVDMDRPSDTVGEQVDVQEDGTTQGPG